MGVENEIRRFCLFVAVRWKLRTGLCLTNIAIRIVHIHWIYVGLDEFNCTQLMDSWTIMYRLCDKYKSVLAQHLFAVAKTVDYVRIKHHPYFWRPERTLSFLLAAAQEVDCAIGSRDAARQCFLHRLECELSAAVIGDDWIAQIHPIIRSEISLPRDDTNVYGHVASSIGHLLLILRALTLKRRREMGCNLALEMAFCLHWIHRFPRLVIHVYEASYHLRSSSRFQEFYTFFAS